MADFLFLAEAAHAAAEHGAEHATPTALGLTPGGWVAASMLAVFALMLYLKVPALIAGALDRKIDGIRAQLAEAAKLRTEAEALRAEYVEKIANAEKHAAAMIDHARIEADQIVAKAEADSAAMIARRKKMAEDKIAAAERGALDELRAMAATAAAAAARGLIANQHDAKADKMLVDGAIAGI
jgi:F-type H+-transporting ATPase subunit b